MGKPTRKFAGNEYESTTQVSTTATGGVGSKQRPQSNVVRSNDDTLMQKKFAVGKVATGDNERSRNQLKQDAIKNRPIDTSTLTDFDNTNTVTAYDLYDAGGEDDDLPTQSTFSSDFPTAEATAHTQSAKFAAVQADYYRNKSLDDLLRTEIAEGVDNFQEIGEPQAYDIRTGINNFAAKPRPPSRGAARPSWASVQTALEHRILPNELYEDDKGEYELTAYQVTIFMLAEGEIFGNKLSDVTKKIRTQKDIKNVGGVVIAQTAGTDEFYIEEFEFNSIVGGPGVIANRFTFTIKSPFQADLVDHIFKAARLLGIRNHNDIPMFVLINWNARHTDTSEVKKFETSRCFSFRIINSSLVYDDSGGLYEIEAVRYAEHNFNTSYASLLEDITIEGHTVIEMMEQLLICLGSVQSKAIDNIIMPDVFRIDLDKEVAAWTMVNKKGQAKKSDVKSNTNNPTAAQKTVADIINNQVSNKFVSAEMSAAAYPIKKQTSSAYFQQDIFLKTATYKKGHSIPAIMEDIISSTEEMQKLATALEDPQGDTAQKLRAKAEKVERFYIKFDAEVELLAYDSNKQQYACKRIYKIRKHLDPTLAKDEKATAQTKTLSMARLSEILRLGLLQKAYPFYYSGLNTEVKSIDFKFDNHWINAVGMYSRMGGMARRQHGVLADSITGAGFTSPAFDSMRDETAKAVAILQGDIKKLDTQIESERGLGYGGGMGGEGEREKARREHMNSEKKVLDDQIELMQQRDNVTAAQLAAIAAKKLTVHTENLGNADPGQVIMATGNKYFVENRPKFEGLVYMGDLSDEITEADVSVMFPVPQIATVLPKKSTGMREEYDRGGTLLSEIVAKREGGDMVSVDLEIRGDPYWIPSTFGELHNDSVSPAFQQPYLIIIASQTMDYNEAGIFQVNERSSLNAVYNVIRVQNRFSGGEFSQVLECKRDMTIDINAVLTAPNAYHAEERLSNWEANR